MSKRLLKALALIVGIFIGAVFRKNPMGGLSSWAEFWFSWERSFRVCGEPAI